MINHRSTLAWDCSCLHQYKLWLTLTDYYQLMKSCDIYVNYYINSISSYSLSVYITSFTLTIKSSLSKTWDIW